MKKVTNANERIFDSLTGMSIISSISVMVARMISEWSRIALAIYLRHVVKILWQLKKKNWKRARKRKMLHRAIELTS